MMNLRGLLLVGSALALAACGADDVASPGEGTIVVPPPTTPPTTPPPGPPTDTPTIPADCPTGTANVGTIVGYRNCQLSGVVTGNLVLPNRTGTIYSLSGGVRIGRDVGGDGSKAGGQQGILTIEPGVVVFGSSGADFLLVERGSQLFANGEATKPIVFTSRANVEGTSTDTSIGQWGGVVVLGRAPINTCIGVGVTPGSVNCEGQVEGADGFYGGATVNDNSGRLTYVQIRYPGFEVTPGNELNGLSLAGVGSGTTIEHVQIHNSSDDGIEWFGGRVNGRHLVLTGADDDSLDTDLGYRGMNQFVLVQQRTTGGDRVIEADSDGNDLKVPRSRPMFANFTFLGNRSPSAVLMRGGTDYRFYNGVFAVSTAAACFDIRHPQTVAAADPALNEDGPPVVSAVFLGCQTAGIGSSGVTQAQVDAALNGNGNVRGTSTLVNGLFPGANEKAIAAQPLTGVSSFFAPAAYIGAFRDEADTWFNGWTCGLAGQPACTAAARPIQ